MVEFLRHLQELIYGTGCSAVNRGMAETEEIAMEDENNVTSNGTSNADTEVEHQKDLVPKRGKRNSIVWLWSDTDQTTVICKTCRQQVVTSNTHLIFPTTLRHSMS